MYCFTYCSVVVVLRNFSQLSLLSSDIAHEVVCLYLDENVKK